MRRRSVVAVVALLAVVVGGVLFVDASSPGTSGLGESGATTATTVAETTSPEPDDRTSGDATARRTTSGSGYSFTIERVENCGNTCRDVTATLANTAAEARTDVRVTTKVYADDELLWSGNETVGTLDAGSSHTSTKRVDVGFAGGLAISANDGYVTIVTVVESASGTTRFSDRRKVA